MILEVDELMDLLRPTFLAETSFILHFFAVINGHIMGTIEAVSAFISYNSIDLVALPFLDGVDGGAVGVFWRKFKNGMFTN